MVARDGEAAGGLGLIGLGRMGANLARNFARHGRPVTGYDVSPERGRQLVEAHPDEALACVPSLEELVKRVARPRCLLLLVPPGDPVDELLHALDFLLDRDDLVVDGGNSHFAATERRSGDAARRGWRFAGMGVSGGAEGALHGPALMPGGEPETWERLRPLLEPVAAQSHAGPCVGWCGRGAAGHFAKMVHNGIEYAEMQHLAESMLLLRRGLGLADAQVAECYESWNRGGLESFLVEITARIFRTRDPEQPGALLLDAILDRAGQKGTGRWAVREALERGVAVPSLAAAVDARVLSSDVELRRRAERAYGGPAVGAAALAGIAVDDVRDALLAARVAAYAQGFALLAAGSREHGYGTELAEIARIWTGGCIIRARLLDELRAALARDPERPLVLDPELAAALRALVPAWRSVVSAAQRAGLPVPALAAGLAWFDSLTTARGSAHLIQAQRDCFGVHGYERRDAPGRLVHGDWGRDS